jgi:hypothetical protein
MVPSDTPYARFRHTDAIDDARTVTVPIHDSKGVFQRNTIERNKKMNGLILSGQLKEKTTVTVRGKKRRYSPAMWNS